MATSLFYVTDDKTRAIRANPELGVYRPQERAELRRGHFMLGRDGEVSNTISAAFETGERLGIGKGVPVSCEDFDFLVLVDFSKKVMGEIADAALAGYAR
ncbi:hypothetical protein EGT36_21090 [Agrobacterium sp. FDAARGOS_525]|uniref:hypothetical protein n=1 Tax=Agrobacterium sp. FDAARGOS_525 TaxID=2420311 RepID=UPI000F659E45|nr:hypothetical protein [Agrobacterium sp. FDAARGOS_525]RSC31179.1 hypothetical protein EGT36_21090 [Agrobacterium sp. FDAARGOS_525]